MVQVIFRDFKTSNVLLDEDFIPRLSDFGLAREGPTEGNTHVSTAVSTVFVISNIRSDKVDTLHTAGQFYW